jgi:hypothetical protein
VILLLESNWSVFNFTSTSIFKGASENTLQEHRVTAMFNPLALGGHLRFGFN